MKEDNENDVNEYCNIPNEPAPEGKEESNKIAVWDYTHLGVVGFLGIIFIFGVILLIFFTPSVTFDLSDTSMAFKISLGIASLGFFSLVFCFAGFLLGFFSFKKNIDVKGEAGDENFNIISTVGITLVFLIISSIPVVYIFFGYLGLMIEFLLLLIPFYIYFGTDLIIKREDG